MCYLSKALNIISLLVAFAVTAGIGVGVGMGINKPSKRNIEQQDTSKLASSSSNHKDKTGPVKQRDDLKDKPNKNFKYNKKGKRVVMVVQVRSKTLINKLSLISAKKATI